MGLLKKLIGEGAPPAIVALFISLIDVFEFVFVLVWPLILLAALRIRRSEYLLGATAVTLATPALAVLLLTPGKKKSAQPLRCVAP